MFKIGKPVEPKFTNAFILEVEYMYGDGDAYESEDYQYLPDNETYTEGMMAMLKYWAIYRWETPPDRLDAEYQQALNYAMIRRDEHDNYATIVNADWYWYDEKGVKHYVEFTHPSQK